MNLKTYLNNNNQSLKEFCQILECGRGYLSRIASGHLRPGKRLAKDIERLTEGKVNILAKSPREHLEDEIEELLFELEKKREKLIQIK